MGSKHVDGEKKQRFPGIYHTRLGCTEKKVSQGSACQHLHWSLPGPACPVVTNGWQGRMRNPWGRGGASGVGALRGSPDAKGQGVGGRGSGGGEPGGLGRVGANGVTEGPGCEATHRPGQHTRGMATHEMVPFSPPQTNHLPPPHLVERQGAFHGMCC